MTRTQLNKAKILIFYKQMDERSHRYPNDCPLPILAKGFKAWDKFNNILNMVKRLRKQYK